MTRGDRVSVKGGACDGLQGVVVKPFGSSTLVRFAVPVRRRNGVLSEEVWLASRQLTVAESVTEATSET